MEFHDDVSHDRVRAREFAAGAIAGSLGERDRASRWDAALWRALGEAGLLGICLPVEHGGGGRSAVALCDALIGFAQGCLDAGLAHAWAAHTIGCGVALASFGTLAQRHEHLPGLARGERVGAFARVEGQVRRRGASWRLDGSARVLNGPVADLFVVGAKLDGGGWVTFVVERGHAGLQVGEREEQVGLRTATIGQLRFVDCELGADALLGSPGSSESLALVRRWQRACQLAPWVGLLDELVRIGLAHGCGRSQTSRALLADMRIRVELCRRVQARAAWRLERGGEGLERELAVASSLLGDAVAAMTHEAARVWAVEPVARMARDAAAVGGLWEGPERARAAVAATLFDFGAHERRPS
jgi:alkylation response protein AidB-like acyl-CoA dehydrogenase